MKALSVRAPWWWAILHGKPIENRNWPTRYRGPMLLHASTWWKRDEVESDLAEARRMATASGVDLPYVDLDQMQAMGGCLVGSFEVVDCVAESPSPWFVGRYGFVLRGARALPHALVWKGALMFFDVPDLLVEPYLRVGRLVENGCK